MEDRFRYSSKTELKKERPDGATTAIFEEITDNFP